MSHTTANPSEEVIETVEEIVAEEPTPIKKPRKKKADSTKTKPRSLEELMYTDVRTMTEKEKTIMIEAQAEELGFLRSQNESLRHNCDLAYEKVRLLEEDTQKMDAFYRSKLSFVTEQLNAFSKTIRLATTGGTN